MNAQRNQIEIKLMDDIHHLEKHLHCLRDGDESAYEKALIRSYEMTFDQYRARLAGLIAA